MKTKRSISYRNMLISLLALFLLGIPSSFGGGGDVGNPGSDLDARLVRMAKNSILSHLQKHPDPEVNMSELQSIVRDFHNIIVLEKDSLIHPEKGYVLAINYPKKRKIHFDTGAWNYRLNQGHDMRYLLYHEILGLMGVPDEGYKKSLKAFPIREEDKSPEFSYNFLECFAHFYTIRHGLRPNGDANLWQFGRNFFLEKVAFKKGEPRYKKYGAMLPMLVDTKNLSHTFDLGFDADGSRYKLQIEAIFYDKLPCKNHEGTSLNLLARLLFQESQDKSPRVISEASFTYSKRLRETGNLLNVEFVDYLYQHGMKMDIGYGGDGFGYWAAMRDHFMTDPDVEYGTPEYKEYERLIVNFLEPFPEVTPVEGVVRCKVVP